MKVHYLLNGPFCAKSNTVSGHVCLCHSRLVNNLQTFPMKVLGIVVWYEYTILRQHG